MQETHKQVLQKARGSKSTANTIAIRHTSIASISTRERLSLSDVSDPNSYSAICRTLLDSTQAISWKIEFSSNTTTSMGMSRVTNASWTSHRR